MENQNPNPQGGSSAPAQPPVQSVFDELKTKKGIKDPEHLAKIYTDLEKGYGEKQNAYNSAKQNLETQTQGLYTLDDKGTMVLTDKGKQHQQYQQQFGQQSNQGQYGQQQDTSMYDPYTGQPITDPIALKLAQLPFGQREMFLINAVAEQREKQQIASFQNETEILSGEEAKGFEQDVKKVMMSLPLQQRADKEAWKRALLQVKGARYDTDKQNWGQQANDNLLNKMGNQGLPPAGQSGGGGSQLPPDLEYQYQQYEKNRPGFFKNREEFLKFNSPTGGK